MAFTVQHHSQWVEFSDDDTYEFKPDGILKVTARDRRLTYYSPNNWETVVSTNGHKPGPLETGQPAD